MLFITKVPTSRLQTGVKSISTHWVDRHEEQKLGELMVYRPEGLTTSKTAVVSNNSDIRILKYSQAFQQSLSNT